MVENSKIMSLIKDRLELGERKYGKSADDIIGDGRDFEQEALEEVLDCMVYTAARLIEIQDKRLINIIKDKKD